MKVLITGASGQLGHDLQRAFADDHVVAAARRQLALERAAQAVAELGDGGHPSSVRGGRDGPLPSGRTRRAPSAPRGPATTPAPGPPWFDGA